MNVVNICSRTELGDPRQTPVLLTRRRLISRALDSHHRLTVLTAPESSGKSGFLHGLQQSLTGQAHCVTLDCRNTDSPLSGLSNLRALLPGTYAADGHSRQSEAALMSTLTLQLLAITEPTHIIVDGLHAERHQQLIRLLVQLVMPGHSQVRWHLAITGTLDPALAALLSLQEVDWMGADVLAFTLPEIQQLCELCLQPVARAETVFARTGGWPAAVIVDLQNAQDATRLCRWMSAEVLSPQLDVRRQDIVGLALLDEFDLRLATEVMNCSMSLAEARLRALCQHGYMQLRILSGTHHESLVRYRWQHPIRHFLTYSLQHKDALLLPDIYLHAAPWLDEAALILWVTQTLQHGQCPWAFLLAGRMCRRWLLQHDSRRILQLIDSSPALQAANLANLVICRVWALLNEQQFLDVEAQLISLRSDLLEQDPLVPFPHLRNAITILTLLLRYFADQSMDKIERDALFRSVIDAEGVLQPVVLNRDATNHYASGRIMDAKSVATRAALVSRQHNNEIQLQIARNMVLICDYMNGEVSSAWHQAETDAADLALRRSLMGARTDRAVEFAIAINDCARAYLYYEADQVAAAEKLLNAAIPMLDDNHTDMPHVLAKVTRAKIDICLGRYGQAEAILTELEQISEFRRASRLQALVCYEKMRLRFYSGRKVDDIAQAYNLVSRSVRVETLFLDGFQEEHLFWLKSKLIVYLVNKDYASASEFALKGVIKALSLGCQRHLATFYMFKALSEFRLGRYQDASSTCSRVLLLCQQHGYRRAIIDDSFGLHDLWQLMRHRGDFAAGLEPDFLVNLHQGMSRWRELVAEEADVPAIPIRLPQGVAEAGLTEKEVEIITLLAEGLCNKKIAMRACIALTTVKWHLQNIFSKLSVRNRTEAVLKAQELSLVEGIAK